MPNDYYTKTINLLPNTLARSGDLNDEFSAIEAALSLLPTLNQLKSDNVSFASAGGTANAITVTHPYSSWSSYSGKNGWKIVIQISSTNTSSVTLSVDGLTPKPVLRNDGSALQSGDLQAGGFYSFVYDEASGSFRVPEAINGVLEDCEEQVTIATAATGFKGLWSDQTGAATKPYCVLHNGAFWALLNNLADVTASEPGVTADWAMIDAGMSYSSLSGAVTAPVVSVHNGKLWALITDSADVTADVPGASSKWAPYIPATTTVLDLGSGWNIDCAGGHVEFKKSVSSSGTFTLSNAPSSGLYTFYLEIVYTSGTVSFFTGLTVIWPDSMGGVAPTFFSGSTYKLAFEVIDGSTVRCLGMVEF